MAEWLAALRERVVRDGHAVLVTVAHTTGSTPREAGTTMVISAGDATGTIGGGHLEFEALRIARDALASTAPLGAWIVRFPLAASLGPCCGGVATLAFNVVRRGEHGWLDTALACRRTHTPFALVSRIGSHAAPLLVSADNVAGSLGTPPDDSAAIALARQRVAAGMVGAMLVPAATADGATLLLHVVRPRNFNILLFGNGHVGRALAQVLGTLDASVRWIDGREHDFPAHVAANVETVLTDDPVAELDAAPRGAWVLILTHSHALDFELTQAALRRDDWSYLGLIGSRSKRNQFEKRLAARDVPPAALARIVCPIGGQPGTAIRSKEPGAIAVAVAAELLALREALAARGAMDAAAAAGVPVAAGTPGPARALRATTQRMPRP
jgi:xanthine dehydrogenase accessory factor